MEKVLGGDYALITSKIYISMVVASQYTDDKGYTPFYINKNSLMMFYTAGWGLR